MEELERKYWFKDPAIFSQSMTGIGLGALTFVVMYEWREKKGDRRLCFEGMCNSDKFEFIEEVKRRMKDLAVDRFQVLKEWEIRDSMKYMGFDTEDYL